MPPSPSALSYWAEYGQWPDAGKEWIIGSKGIPVDELVQTVDATVYEDSERLLLVEEQWNGRELECSYSGQAVMRGSRAGMFMRNVHRVVHRRPIYRYACGVFKRYWQVRGEALLSRPFHSPLVRVHRATCLNRAMATTLCDKFHLHTTQQQNLVGDYVELTTELNRADYVVFPVRGAVNLDIIIESNERNAKIAPLLHELVAAGRTQAECREYLDEIIELMEKSNTN